ncbi:cytochrome P450 [Pseudonocardia sediminis]|uniref:Cytochrome P450 n=1 Tax=Pseudonocardia sediminis TaxID=1397368 RepID=A0A4Q7UWH5_PSEST|nr:cytochrome P450 [Pseudonocardia sediminis]RZT85338.1 cytochrome P450 [Pseudonocardia sediminis]
MTDTQARPDAPVMPLHMQRNRFDPNPEISRYREDGEVPYLNAAFGLDAFVVTHYDDVREVLGDAATFGNTADIARRRGDTVHMSEEEAARMRAGQLLAQDPPEHTRLRRMLTREFTQARMRRLQPRIDEIVESHLDAMEAAGPPADLVADFALPIPSLVICELLGVPYADRAEFQTRSNRLLDMTLEPKERMEVARENRAYMSKLVTGAQADPGEDILGMLVRDHGDELTHDELTGIASLLLIAGHETTSNMLGLGTLALLENPEQLALVRDEPDLARASVEELLRWLSIVHSGVPRLVMADTEIRGVAIPEGSLVVCSLPAANRDSAQIEDPDRLDVRRGAAGHVAFGHGIHHCLGAPLARMEMETAFPALLRRFPTLARAETTEEVPFRAYSFIYGLAALPVTW